MYIYIHNMYTATLGPPSLCIIFLQGAPYICFFTRFWLKAVSARVEGHASSGIGLVKPIELAIVMMPPNSAIDVEVAGPKRGRDESEDAMVDGTDEDEEPDGQRDGHFDGVGSQVREATQSFPALGAVGLGGGVVGTLPGADEVGGEVFGAVTGANGGESEMMALLRKVSNNMSTKEDIGRIRAGMKSVQKAEAVATEAKQLAEKAQKDTKDLGAKVDREIDSLRNLIRSSASSMASNASDGGGSS